MVSMSDIHPDVVDNSSFIADSKSYLGSVKTYMYGDWYEEYTRSYQEAVNFYAGSTLGGCNPGSEIAIGLYAIHQMR